MPKFNYQNIPQELRNLKQWGLFELKWVEARKKNTKILVKEGITGYAKRYAAMVSSADKGAIINK